MVASTDIKWYLSGGSANTDPAASLGGNISDTEILSATLGNLFDQVAYIETQDGVTDYRCAFIKNTHVSDPAYRVKLYVGDQPVNPGIGVEIAKPRFNFTIPNDTTNPSVDYREDSYPYPDNDAWDRGGAYSPTLDATVFIQSIGPNSSTVGIMYSIGGVDSFQRVDDVNTTPDLDNVQLTEIIWSTLFNEFILLAQNGIYTSPDAINWTRQVTQTAFASLVEAKNRGEVLASRSGGSTWYRYDGVSWTEYPVNASGLTAPGGMSYAEDKGLFVIADVSLDNHKVLWSEDGVNWTPGDFTNAGGIRRAGETAYSEELGVFLACGETSQADAGVVISNDGKTWRLPSNPPSAGSVRAECHWSQSYGALFASRATTSGALDRSFDGENWDTLPVPAGDYDFVEADNWVNLTNRASTPNRTSGLRFQRTTLSFVAPPDAETGIDLGDIGPGESIPIWFKRTVAPGTVGGANDQFTVSIDGFGDPE